MDEEDEADFGRPSSYGTQGGSRTLIGRSSAGTLMGLSIRWKQTGMQRTWGHCPMRVRIQGEPMASLFKLETGTEDPPDIVDSRQAGR